MKVFLPLTLLFSLFLLCSCGKSKSGGGVPGQLMSFEPEGSFTANLAPVNQKLSKKVTSTINVSKFGDEFSVTVHFKNGSLGRHRQGLYSGEACPTDDPNGDGQIDWSEAEKSLGALVLPFDGDLSGLSIGSEFFPSEASYDYERSTSYALMLSDPEMKGKELYLEGKVVLIQGISEVNSIPADQQEFFPVSCGILSSATIGPTEETPEPPRRVRPRHTRRAGKPVIVKPEPKPQVHGTFWCRLRHRFEAWWGRLGGRKGGKLSGRQLHEHL